MARRISWDEPSLTLTCSPAQKQTERCHPDETRPFTVRGYARIQIFLNDGKPSVTLSNEVFRQGDRSISNAIGLFHQRLIGSIDGFAETLTLPCDVKKLDNTIFAEIKNKHNTMNVRSAAAVYEELEGIARSYPEATCFLVEIVAKKSTNEVWRQVIFFELYRI